MSKYIQKHPKTVFSGPRSKASYRYLRSTIFHDTKYGWSLEIDEQTNEGLVDHTFSCLACTLVHADLHHRAKLHGGSRHGPIFKRRKTSCRTRKDGKNICKLWWSTVSRTAKWTATHKPIIIPPLEGGVKNVTYILPTLWVEFWKSKEFRPTICPPPPLPRGFDPSSLKMSSQNVIPNFCHCMSIRPSPVMRKHSHKKLPKVSNDGFAASCSTEAKHSLDTARPRLHASVNLLPIAVSFCTPFWIWSKFKVHTGPYFRLVFAGLLDGGSLGSGTGWAGNGFHVPQVSSSSSSIFVVWLRAVEATPQSFLSLFSVLCQSFQDFWPFQPHSLLSALQLAALLGASCAFIMPLRVFPCAQQCKQMQSNARRVDMLASNAMSPPCMWVSSLLPSSFSCIWKHNEKQPALGLCLKIQLWKVAHALPAIGLDCRIALRSWQDLWSHISESHIQP